ncbi:hypothetical protein N8E89_08670 [Phyllobacterium sp. A18/5-2]|nr:hypothetical protein [Phyllobacterium sp. A18/5-2]UXN65650.1 hypothetical protein N8E89_08670 [Phyllobacterium sp. A18/5-2]
MKSVFARKALTLNGWENDVLLHIDTLGRIASVVPNSAADS